MKGTTGTRSKYLQQRQKGDDQSKKKSDTPKIQNAGAASDGYASLEYRKNRLRELQLKRNNAKGNGKPSSSSFSSAQTENDGDATVPTNNNYDSSTVLNDELSASKTVTKNECVPGANNGVDSHHHHSHHRHTQINNDVSSTSTNEPKSNPEDNSKEVVNRKREVTLSSFTTVLKEDSHKTNTSATSINSSKLTASLPLPPSNRPPRSNLGIRQFKDSTKISSAVTAVRSMLNAPHHSEPSQHVETADESPDILSPHRLPPPRSLSYDSSNHDGNSSSQQPKTPESITSPLKNLRQILSSVSSINRAYNTPSNKNPRNAGSVASAGFRRYMRTPSFTPIANDSSEAKHKHQGQRNIGSASSKMSDSISRANSRRNSNTSSPTSFTSITDNFTNINSTSSNNNSLEHHKRQFSTIVDSIYTLDATCVRYNSNITIRSHYVEGNNGIVSVRVEPKYNLSSIIAEGKIGNDHADILSASSPRFEATSNGVGLGRELEVLTIVSSNASMSSVNNSYLYKGDITAQQEQRETKDEVVCYGDTVALLSSVAMDRALGVRKYSSVEHENDVCRFELGFFRTLLGQAEKWTVLWGGEEDRKPVDVGIDVGNLENNLNVSNVRPVRSGEAVVLRNILTGGVLALEHSQQKNNSSPSSGLSLTTLTSSEGDPSSALSHPASGMFNVVLPGIFETWRIQQVNSPPCPRWTLDYGGRPYLNGKYLLDVHRNEPTPHAEKFFQCNSEWNDRNQYNRGEVQSQRLVFNDSKIGDCSIAQQESILLSEMIGALMGLEGQVVRVYPDDTIDISNTNDEYENRSSSMTDETLNPDGTFEDTFHPKNTSCLERIVFSIKEETQSSSKIDVSLLHLAKQILPLCTKYARLNAFVLSRASRHEFGLVMQALVSSINSLLQEYLVFVCQMEHLLLQEKLTLQKLWCFIQPSFRTIQILYDVAKWVHNLKGGALINGLQTLVTSLYDGDEHANDILVFLIDRASVPYMKMLSLWLSTGQFHDPFDEFLIDVQSKEEMISLNGDNWDNFYSIREEQLLLRFLDSSVNGLAEKILTTGKYLNVMRHCHEQGLIFSSKYKQQKLARMIEYKMGSIRIGEHIQRCFSKAASSLLRVIMEEHCLVDRLMSIKRYFLLNQGDFFVQFLDLAEGELLQEISKVSKGRVQSLLSMAMQLGGAGAGAGSRDDNFHDIQCGFATCSVVNHLDTIHQGGIASNDPRTPKRTTYGGSQQTLTGVEAFMLDYTIKWPLSIVISKKTIASYQLIFRHLFFSKHVERRLFETWLDHQMIKELNLRSVLGPTYLLRQRMLHFMQNFVYYVMFEVIEPRWHKMKMLFTDARTIDEVIDVHNNFLTSTQKECLLKNKALLKTLTKIMQTCLLFSDQMKRFAKSTKIDDENIKIAVEERQKRVSGGGKPNLHKMMASVRDERRKRVAKLTDRMKHAIESDNYQKMIQRFVQVFDTQMSDFMTQLVVDSQAHYHAHLTNLSTRLDFNGYVTKSMKTR